MRDFNWVLFRDRLKEKLKEAILFLPNFLKNPVAGMRALPDWDWPTMIVLQSAFALACSTLANLLERDVFGLITGIVIAPIRIVILTGVAAGFFFYTFMFFFTREIEFRRIYLHLVLATIPMQIVAIAHFLLPPISLIGLIATLALLFVGFTHNFYLDPKKLKKILGAIFIAFAIFWLIQFIRTTTSHQNLKMRATPESLDILEKELNP